MRSVAYVALKLAHGKQRHMYDTCTTHALMMDIPGQAQHIGQAQLQVHSSATAFTFIRGAIGHTWTGWMLRVACKTQG